MALLTRDQIKNLIVKPALESVADFDEDFEDFDFEHFHDFSMSMFTSKLKENLDSQGYDVLLNSDVINAWNTFKDCIDYIDANHFEK